MDFYTLLNVPRDAKLPQIRNAFRKLALANHPHKNPNPNAHETFVKLNEAYQILSDPKKRKQYDTLTDIFFHTGLTSAASEKYRNLQKSMHESTEKSHQEAEAYVKDFDFFSKKVLKKVGLEILLGAVAMFFFGEFYRIL